tara:strand:- start:3835 stop:4038 length:204 start_codon:yes stop_codon:yes gene_type:complete
MIMRDAIMAAVEDQFKVKFIDCYQCGKPSYELSPRSRCVSCEYAAYVFNEAEAEQLKTILIEKGITV